MNDQNVIQIETNIKIVEEKQNHQVNKRNLSWASDLSGTLSVRFERHTKLPIWHQDRESSTV